MQSGEESIIDSFYTQDPQIVSSSNRNEFAVAARWGDRSEIYVLRWKSEYQRRVFKLECGFGEVAVNNLAVSSGGNELIFDVESGCSFLTVNARHTIGVGSNSWAEDRHGDRVKIQLDDQLLIESVHTQDYDAATEANLWADRNSAEAAETELRECMRLKEAATKEAKNKNTLEICQSTQFPSSNGDLEHAETWNYIILVREDNAYAPSVSGRCKGEDFDHSKSTDGKSMILGSDVAAAG